LQHQQPSRRHRFHLSHHFDRLQGEVPALALERSGIGGEEIRNRPRDEWDASRSVEERKGWSDAGERRKQINDGGGGLPKWIRKEKQVWIMRRPVRVRTFAQTGRTYCSHCFISLAQLNEERDLTRLDKLHCKRLDSTGQKTGLGFQHERHNEFRWFAIAVFFVYVSGAYMSDISRDHVGILTHVCRRTPFISNLRARVSAYILFCHFNPSITILRRFCASILTLPKRSRIRAWKEREIGDALYATIWKMTHFR
jgi:hypothetical protein